MKSLYRLLLLFVFTAPLWAASHSPAGDWLGYYEDTNIPGAKIHVSVAKNGDLNAYYVEVYPKAGEKIPDTCTDCKGKFKNMPLKNMPMLWNLIYKRGKWVDGHGYSLERRRTFNATAWLSDDGNTLYVRGRVGLFSKTQKLKRLS